VDKALQQTATPLHQIEAAEAQRAKVDEADRQKIAEGKKRIDALTGSSLPVVGSIEASVIRFGQGDYVRGTANAVMAISDLGLVKSLAVSGGKVALRAGGALFGSQREALGYLAARIVPASEGEAAAVRFAYANTETTSKAGDLAHELLGAKGPNQGIDFGISRVERTLDTGEVVTSPKLETGVIKELKTNYRRVFEIRDITKADEQLLKASLQFQAQHPGIVSLRIQTHLFLNPANGDVVRLRL